MLRIVVADTGTSLIRELRDAMGYSGFGVYAGTNGARYEGECRNNELLSQRGMAARQSRLT